MPIKNPDGSVARPSGTLQQYDPQSTEHDLFNLWDQEVIEIGGLPLEYYNVFINVSDIDELYMEARNKIYSQHPVCLYGYYDPIPASNALGTFGIDSPDEMMFEFNFRYVMNTLGFVPKIGARIHTPFRNEDWMVVQRNVEVFKLWGQLRLQIMCVRFQESLTTGEGRVARRKDYSVNTIKDLGANRMNLAGGQPPGP